MLKSARRPRTAFFATLLRALGTGLGVLLVSAGSILLVLGLYHANAGVATYHLSYDRTQEIDFSCGTQTPQFNPSGPGNLVFHGENETIRAIHVYGPARPQIATNASNAAIENASTGDYHAGAVTRQAFTSTCRGYALKAVGLAYGVAFLVLGVILIGLRLLRRDLVRTWLKFMAVAGITLTLLLGVTAGLTDVGTQPLFHVTSPTQVFSYSGLRIIPPPAPEVNPDPIIAVNGDSRLSGYNGSQLVTNPTAADKACQRTRGDLASELASMSGVAVLDTACPGADVDMGFFDREFRNANGVWVPSQVSLDEAAPNVQTYVVDPGMNSVGWGLLAGFAKLSNADIPLVPVSITAAIAHLKPFMDDLLTVYRNRPGHHQVIIIGSYQAFPRGVDLSGCPDAQGYSPQEIALLSDQVDRINGFLTSWAADNGAVYVQPNIRPLCTRDTTGLGPDIVGMHSRYRFHLTPEGILKLAVQVNDQIHLKPIPLQPQSPGPYSARIPQLGLASPIAVRRQR